MAAGFAILLAACPSPVLAGVERNRMTLSPVWEIQPATAPDVSPSEGAWGKVDTTVGDWRWTPLVGDKPLWRTVKREDVNSLWYRQRFDAPATWNNCRVIADFRRIEGDAIVFVNGKRVGELLRPGGEVDITGGVAFGQPNTLTVFVTRSYIGISRGFEQDMLRHAARAGGDPMPMSRWSMGLTAPVTLIARPRPVGLTNVFVRPSWRTKSLAVNIETDATAATRGLIAVVDILDASGNLQLTLRSTPFDAPAGLSTHIVSGAWQDPIPWELNGAYLYTGRVRLESDGQVMDAYPDVKFGFREIWTSGKLIMINGHPARFRLASLGEGAEDRPEGLSFFRLIGYNVIVVQNNPTAWWRDWSETMMPSDSMLDELDRTGMGVLFAAPSINYLGSSIISNSATIDAYTRETNLYLRRYRNHPSILALTVGMNTYNPQAPISPQGMGRRDPMTHPKAKAIAAACAIVKSIDPTRPIYSHADGGVGDICSGNMYLNFAPLQEREEWPSEWSVSGDMPAMAAEFGQPFTANFWKDKRCLFTEYLAMYLGDRAYASETNNALKTVIDSGLANTSGFGDMTRVDLADYPSYWDFQRLFVGNTNRAWRTWGVNGGWSYWVLDTGYGDPPAFHKTSNLFTRYRKIDGMQTSRPAWANPNFDIHSEANQPLLAYIAGDPEPTDKTHAYYSGEFMRKNLALVWDGPGDRSLTVSWKVGSAPSKSVAVTLRSGDIKLVPVVFPVPTVKERRDVAMALNVRDGANVVATDSLALEFFPHVARLTTETHVALYDPKGLSQPILTALGISARPWKPGDSLAHIDLLVLGREALAPGIDVLYKPVDIARGLRVIVLEQKPDVWKALGFKITDTMPRYVFARDIHNPVLSGLRTSDLINWRGSPDLLPEAVTGSHDALHAPKWTNRHAVASVALQIPEAIGFTPLLACEFDMNYSPLLELRYGAGSVTFCSLDLTGRVGVDPDATLLARNLLTQSLGRTRTEAKSIGVAGDLGPLASAFNLPENGTKLPPPANGLVIAGAGLSQAENDALTSFVRNGGTVVRFMSDAKSLHGLGYETAPASLYRADPGESVLFRSIGQSLLRWRDHLDVDAFTSSGQPAGSEVMASGLILSRSEGRGRWVYCQASPAVLSGRYATDPDRTSGIQTSVSRLYQLAAQLVTNLGASAPAAAVARVSRLDLGPAFKALRQWQELGPFPYATDDGAGMLATKFPGEESAIAGDTNPNIDYVAQDGRRLNWRKTVMADSTGHVDLPDQLGPSGFAVAYFVGHIHSDHTRTTMLRLGVDYRIEVWVNGVLTFRTLNGRSQPNSFQVNIPLNPGDNVITIKLGSGSKGFAFWSDVAAEMISAQGSDTQPLNANLYHVTGPDFDPYEFRYW